MEAIRSGPAIGRELDQHGPAGRDDIVWRVCAVKASDPRIVGCVAIIDVHVVIVRFSLEAVE
eukprot:SAG31_NODE_2493_length_5611_cov_8.195755_8_plen_62_part_00